MTSTLCDLSLMNDVREEKGLSVYCLRYNTAGHHVGLVYCQHFRMLRRIVLISEEALSTFDHSMADLDA